ncbi:MAG: hypothetical protein AAF577_11665 [Pseudomonadota bacterium]
MVFLFVLLAVVVAAFALLPCPDPTPPAGFLGQGSRVWTLLWYLIFGLYALVPMQNFQFWAMTGPIVFPGALAIVFLMNGGFAHGTFLIIELVLATLYVGMLSSFLFAAKEIFSFWQYWGLRLAGAFVVPLYAKAQAIDVSQSLC